MVNEQNEDLMKGVKVEILEYRIKIRRTQKPLNMNEGFGICRDKKCRFIKPDLTNTGPAGIPEQFSRC